jgi:hypothetical protein
MSRHFSALIVVAHCWLLCCGEPAELGGKDVGGTAST